MTLQASDARSIPITTENAKENRVAKRWGFVVLVLLLLILVVPRCEWADRGLAKLEVEEELRLGMPLDEVKSRWYQYSTKPLIMDTTMSDTKTLTYRALSRDVSVNTFYLRFDMDRTLREVEWRFRPSMAEVKEIQLEDYWVKRLWKPVKHRGFDGTTYEWADRKAKLELYVSTGICHLTHKLR
jgi:hypothetical protein